MFISTLNYPKDEPDPNAKKSMIAGRRKKKSIPCRYHFDAGFCHFGERCHFGHSKKAQASTDDKSAKAICWEYTKKGSCVYGDKCFYEHAKKSAGAEVKAQSATAATGSGSGANEEKKEEKETVGEGGEQKDPISCSVCYNPPEIMGLLDCCDHCFCVACILEWRNKGKKNPFGNNYNCPVCRRKCSFVLRSPRHLAGAARVEYFDKFKAKAAKKVCKKWLKGKCARASTCLYKHAHPVQSPKQNNPTRKMTHLGTTETRERRFQRVSFGATGEAGAAENSLFFVLEF